MLRKLQLFVPGFLRKLDRYLLLHHPVIWATRIHFVGFYSLLAYGLVALAALDVEVSGLPDIPARVGLLFLPVAMGAGIWAYWVYHSRPERSYGMLKPAAEGLTHLLYVLGILMIGFLPLVYGFAMALGIQKAIPRQELRQDIEALKAGMRHIHFPERDLQLGYYYDTHELLEEKMDWIFPRKESLPESEDAETALHHVSAFYQAMEKYGAPPSPFTTSEIRARILAGEAIPWEAGLQALGTVEHNLETLSRAQTLKYPFFQGDFLHFFIFLILLAGLAFVVYVKVSFRQFVLALVLGTALLVGMAILTAVMSLVALKNPAFQFPHKEEIAFSLPFILLFAGKIWFSFSGVRPYASWKPVTLAMATMMTPFLPIILYTLGYYTLGGPTGISEQTLYKLLLLAPMGIAFVIWHFLYRPRLQKLFAMPAGR